MLKQFPQLLGVAHPDDLSHEQELWLLHQIILDTGQDLCLKCHTMISTVFCGECGTKRGGDAQPTRECKACKSQVSTAYCGYCGAVVVHPIEAAMEAGTFDWHALEQQLKPFMGGLTPEDERQLLTMGQMNGYR